MEEIKAEYEKLRAKYKLTSFDELDRYFEVSSLECKQLLLPSIRKKIHEKIDHFCLMLEDLLHPNSDLRSMYEDRFFNEAEKEQMFVLYKRLMALSRRALELTIETDEKDDAGFIKDITKEWGPIKEELSKIAEKLKQSWQKEIESDSRLEYLG